MDTAEIRRRFVAHFEAAGHQAVPSASLLVPDPTLLFVNAGMVPFKPYFLGQETPPWPRATSVQKCVRTPDIEDVGKTTRHGTFFEMCGNFSFGDYFKEGAIELAWDLVTKPLADGGWGLEESRLWPSVLQGDDEALRAVDARSPGCPSTAIVKLGRKENYWSMGVPGPGGPCSEILYDRGPAYGPEADWESMGTGRWRPELEDRYLEIWNLVFMQDELSAVRSKEDFDIVGSLPKQEHRHRHGPRARARSCSRASENMYEIDVMFPVIEKAEELTGRSYGANHDDDVRFRVVADHVRSSMMLIGDGVTPGNEGRGYVLRRLLRRAVRSMRLLGYEDRALPELFPVSRDKMGETYTELHRDWDRISTVAFAEEDAFRQTLRTGTTIFDTAATEVALGRRHGALRRQGVRAARHLRLPDRPDPRDGGGEGPLRRRGGLPPADDRAARAGAGRRAGQEGPARRGRRLPRHRRHDRPPVEFTGYDEVVSEGAVRGIVSDGAARRVGRARVTRSSWCSTARRSTPRAAVSSPTRASSSSTTGAASRCYDVQSPITGLIVHKARVLDGEVSVGGHAQSLVDIERRASISRSHTATHMVHKAFREALGETATQAGSENSPGRFRFDFSASGRGARSRRWTTSRRGSTTW